MAAILKGTTGPVLVRDEFEFSPDTGRRGVVEYRGTKLAILGMTPSFERDGTSYRIFKADDVYYGLIATWQTTETINTDNIRWSLTTETLQRSIFSFPPIAKEIANYSNPAALKEAISRAASTGSGIITDNFSSDTTQSTPVVFAEGSYPWSYTTLEELTRGVDHYDDEFLVLRREAIKSARAPLSRMRLELNQTSLIYGTSDLGLPNSVAFQIPSVDDLIQNAPANSYWGWRLRVCQSDFEGESIRQTHEFVLSNWSLNLYSRATSAFVYTA